MITVNFTEFKNELTKFLDSVENNHEKLMIKRKPEKGVVLISLNEYNLILETLHLLNSKANADRLYESIQQMRRGKIVKHDLIDD